MALVGGDQLRARFRAIADAFRDVGKDWAEAATEESRRDVGGSGRVAATIRPGVVDLRKAEVLSSAPAAWMDQGTTPHSEPHRKPGPMRFVRGGQVIWARKVSHPGQRGTGFALKAGRAALDKVDLLGKIVERWNRAA